MPVNIAMRICQCQWSFLSVLITFMMVSFACTAASGIERAQMFTIEKLLDRPIIEPSLSSAIGDNIQGPSLIRVPDWVKQPLGAYYLYFADHKGKYIRLAYADDLTGPWKIHEPGSLQLVGSKFLLETPAVEPALLEQARKRVQATPYPHDIKLDLTVPHIASPDVHIDAEKRKIIMYFHGLNAFASQVTRVAESTNGIDFVTNEEVLGRPYMRVFKHQGYHYAMSMPGQFYRSRDGLTNFERGPGLFEANMRHAALLVRDDKLLVFWTRVGDAPERILLSSIDITADWSTWTPSGAVEILRPEASWEGAGEPVLPSMRSVAYGHVNQLRDPAIYVEADRIFLLYAVAGEFGIAIAELHPTFVPGAL